MSDRHTIHLHSDFLDDELPAALREQVLEHITVCQSCRQDLDGMKRAVEILGKISVLEPAEGYFDNVTERILAKTISQSDKPMVLPTIGILSTMSYHRTIRVFLRVAAVIALMVITLLASELRINRLAGTQPVDMAVAADVYNLGTHPLDNPYSIGYPMITVASQAESGVK